MKLVREALLLSAVALAGACSPGGGSDALAPREQERGASPLCLRCHAAPAIDPVLINGTGTQGKHAKHVAERGIDCERCHFNYGGNAAHMNGEFDARSGGAGVGVVAFDIQGPKGAWTKTGPGAGTCAGVACHGAEAMDWYGDSSWVLPACTNCHSAAFSDALDPLVLNGTPPGGRHAKHSSERGIGCERCHANYTGQTTHMNGVLDAGDPSIAVVQFDIIGTAGSWAGDTGPGTGDCLNIACHAGDRMQWYGASAWTLPAACAACHTSAFSQDLDPLVTNGSGLAGKHVKHVSNLGYGCVKCHQEYPASRTHANGVLDTPDSAASLIAFDANNSAGRWMNDTGPETGSCSSLTCHGTSEPAWYTAWSLPACSTCHNVPLGARRQVLGTGGDFGANGTLKSRHVARAGDPTSAECLVCHDLSTHAAGTVRLKNADTGASVVYDPASPATLEPFCLSCHDANGALVTSASGTTPLRPFNDGRTLGVIPNAAGSRIAGYWNGSTAAHRSNGLTCAGSGAPATGCHGSSGRVNMHGSVSQGLLAQNMTFPVPVNSSGTVSTYFVYDYYKLCLDCHDASPAVSKEVVLGVKQGGHYDDPYMAIPYYVPSIQSLFRERFIQAPAQYPAYWSGVSQPYNDTRTADTYLPLHNYHLISMFMRLNWWKYRGQDAAVGRATCTTCHNVHGTNGSLRGVYDEFGMTRFTGIGADQYARITPEANNNFAVMGAYPMFCAGSCHIAPGTSYWYAPADE